MDIAAIDDRVDAGDSAAYAGKIFAARGIDDAAFDGDVATMPASDARGAADAGGIPPRGGDDSALDDDVAAGLVVARADAAA